MNVKHLILWSLLTIGTSLPAGEFAPQAPARVAREATVGQVHGGHWDVQYYGYNFGILGWHTVGTYHTREEAINHFSQLLRLGYQARFYYHY